MISEVMILLTTITKPVKLITGELKAIFYLQGVEKEWKILSVISHAKENTGKVD